MNVWQSAPFLRAYHLLPHALLNRAALRLSQARRPAWAVQAAIRLWARRAQIDLDQFEDRQYHSIEDFFLRRLRPGARPLAPAEHGGGWLAPVDGRVVAAGRIEAGGVIPVKGQALSLDRVVNGRQHHLPLASYLGGTYLVLFLSPRGYHYVHMPVRGAITACQWLPGRFFPQNDAALRHIQAVYEHNERLVLCGESAGSPFLLVMVGASLVGGIHLRGLPRGHFARSSAVPCALLRDRGEELGHFSFGSTVVLLWPAALRRSLTVRIGDDLSMGQPLFG